ncbi:unnamed protein product [Brassicogethes aeneus]|uniref:Carboxylic ester hydrolase n=1 Tax=Brassicogethes aeneus TaxID=1431903 RepID=A0A9P0B0F3_BRAAE|nr:unnamed protein product [Brassicogethes aeneus]
MIKCAPLLIILFGLVSAQGPIVETLNGKILGKIRTTRANVTYYSYTEVPFAKPPIGKLRFQPPEPVQNWEGILDCTKSTKICYQVWNDVKEETEDCLLLNIFTPIAPRQNASLPVIFHMFAGGFVFGLSTFDSNGPHYFMEYDVVIVTVNYRIGPFGFLSTGDTIVPGNMGLKDQNMALRWLQKNIQFFGGDPNKVTIFGMSAGSASVTYHVISKQSKGLFRAAMGESGSALCPWTYQRYAKKVAHQLAKLVDPNFNSSCSKQLLTLLQNVSARDIDKVSNRVNPGYTMELIFGFKYAPVIEPEHDGAFITKNIYVSIEKGEFTRVPMMLGIASEEGLLQVGDNRTEFREKMASFDNNLTEIVPFDLHITDPTLKETVGREIRNIYTDGMFQNSDAASTKHLSDTCFSRAIIKHVELHSKYADAFLYQFSYDGTITKPIMPYYVKGAERVAHTEYSTYIWAYNDNDDITSFPESDILTSKRYLTLLTNFAKTMNPTPKEDDMLQNISWPKVEIKNYQYLDIDTDLSVKKNPKEESYTKWVDLYERRGVKPYDTY